MLLGDGRRRKLPDQNIDDIALQLDRWERSSLAHRAWAEGKEDLPGSRLCYRFVEGDQWAPEDAATLRAEGRPRLTLNKISPLTRLVHGYFEQNKYEVRYLPAASGAGSDESAKALNYCAKQVMEVNGSAWNDGEVARDGLFGGRGYFDIRISDTKNAFGEIVERVLDPFSVYPDPEADSYDPAEWQFVQTSHWFTWNDVQMIFGPRASEAIDARGGGPGRIFGNVVSGTLADTEAAPERWFGLYEYLGDNLDASRFAHIGTMVPGSPLEHVDQHRKLIRLIESQHYRLRPVKQFVDMQTGVKKTIPDHWDRDRIVKVVQYMAFHGLPLAVVDGYEKRVRHTISAADIILFDDWSPYDTFTVIPYFAYFRRGVTRGMIHDLIDPQREINKRRSVFLHIVMTMANSGWLVEDGALEDEYVQLLEEEGSRPGIVIKHKKDGKPERIQAGSTPVAVRQAEKDATLDLKEISGVNDSALGQIDRVQSGRAIAARQKQSVMGAEGYFKNFSRTRELKGRKYLELIQGWYTEPRLIRVRGEDGKNIDTMLNQRLADGAVLNDVTLGSYTVAVDEAPMSATFDQAQFDDIVTMVKDLGIPIPPDIVVEASNVPRKREIINRMAPPVPAAPTPGVPGDPAAPPQPLPPAAP